MTNVWDDTGYFGTMASKNKLVNGITHFPLLFVYPDAL